MSVEYAVLRYKKTMTLYRTILFSFVFFLFSVSVTAQGGRDPVDRLSMEIVRTRNFEIAVERSSEHPRPTPNEIGTLVERLCQQLDKIFVKYTPKNVVKAAEAEAAIKDEKKPTPFAKKKTLDDYQPDEDRVIPKCRIYIFNTREGMDAKCQFDGIGEKSGHYAGFYTTKSNSIYMIRSGSLQSTRETLLHETTHYYSFNFLPGGWRCYPEWFHEGLATSYENHIWKGDKLNIGVQPRIQPFDRPASALKDLVWLRTYLDRGKKDEPPLPVDDKKGVTKKGPPAKSTVIDPARLESFFETEFSPGTIRDRVLLTNEQEWIPRRYAMYQALGRYLLVGRPDFLDAMLRQIALWENEKTKNPPRKDWFAEAWKKVAAEKPITVEDVGIWIQKNQLPFKYVFRDWQDMGDEIAAKAEDSKISILLLRDPNVLPKFTVYPKTPDKFQVGVVINFIDDDNFGVIAVDQDGDVILLEQRYGVWTIGRNIGKTGSAPNKNGPYPGGPAFQFAVSTQGGAVSVYVNKVLAGPFPKHRGTRCGFFLSSTEAIFSY